MDEVVKKIKEKLKAWSTILFVRNKKLQARLLKETQIQIYADDIALIADSRIIERSYDMMLNVKKTKYMSNRIIQRLEEKEIEKVKQFKYLGIIVNMRDEIQDNDECYKITKFKKAIADKTCYISFLDSSQCQLTLNAQKWYFQLKSEKIFDFGTFMSITTKIEKMPIGFLQLSRQFCQMNQNDNIIVIDNETNFNKTSNRVIQMVQKNYQISYFSRFRIFIIFIKPETQQFIQEKREIDALQYLCTVDGDLNRLEFQPYQSRTISYFQQKRLNKSFKFIYYSNAYNNLMIKIRIINDELKNFKGNMQRHLFI